MTISLRAVGATTVAAAAVTPLTPGSPGVLANSDISILVVEIKGQTAGVAPTITTPSGWTIIGSVTNNGTLVNGTDTGSNTIGMYYRIGNYPAPSITTTGGNSAGAGIVAYKTSTDGGWDVSSTTTGSDTASGANGSITGGADLSSTTGDWVIIGAGLSGDIGSVSAQSYTATSGTFGTLVSRSNIGVTTGNDSRLLISDIPQTAGTTSAAAAYTYTNASSTTAHARFVRLREIAPKVATVIDTFDGSSLNAMWTNGGAATISSGAVHLPANGYGSTYAINTNRSGGYDLTNSELVVEIPATPSTTSADGPFLTIELYDGGTPGPANNYIRWFLYLSGTSEWAMAYKNTGAEVGVGTNQALGSGNRWLRIKHDGTNVLWDTSSDGITWTNRGSVAIATVNVPYTALGVSLRAGADTTNTGTFDVGTVGNYVPPAKTTVYNYYQSAVDRAANF